MRRHRFALALLFLVATMIFAAPLFRGEVFVVRDHLDYFQPLRWFTAQELRAGHLPLWNPYSASGEPWLANPQTGVFYPPAWLFVVLPFPTAYMLFLLVHLVILGWGAYLLFARTSSQGAAMVGAVAIMLCGPTLSLLDVNNNLATLAWLPLVVWCAAERAWRRGAVTLALAFLAGEPFFAAVGAAMFLLWTAAAPAAALHRGGDAAASKSGGFATAVQKSAALRAGIAAFGLSAIQLFPFLEAIRDSDRAAGMSRQLILRDSMPIGDWLRVAIPPSFTVGAWDPKIGQHFIPVIYLGMLVVALAIVGATSIRRRHVLGWIALLVIAIVIGAGPAFLARLPLTLFRYPARMVPLGALAIAGLAATGWDRVRGKSPRWADLVLVLLVIADLVPRARPLLVTAPFSTAVVPYAQSIGDDRKLVRAGEIAPAQRVNWISGYLNLYQHRFDTNTAAPFTSERYLRVYNDLIEAPTAEKMAFMSAGYVLASIRVPQGLKPIARAGEVTVYRNPTAYPMARFVTALMIGGKWEMTTSRARIGVNAPADGPVILTQQLAPGWRVTVDGQPRRPLLVAGVFRGVEVTRGHHEIIWSYRPWSLVIGAIVTLVTTLALGISIVVKRWR